MSESRLAGTRFGVDLSELFRRYFVNTVFDSTFVVLGILAATSAESIPNVKFAVSTLFAAALAMGISTGVSVYEAESIEHELRIERLERALLASMEDSDLRRSLRATRIGVAIVNFLTPLLVAFITSVPLLLHEAAFVSDFLVASAASGALGVGIIFSSGFFLGRLSKKNPWRKAVRMSIIAVLTFAVLFFAEQVL